MSELPPRQTEARTQRELALSDWEAVVNVFHDLFGGLGDIEHDESGISFTSRPPDVDTGLSLRKDGLIAASMPLHGMEAKVHSLRWDASRTWVELVGDGVHYRYRIPTELLRHRATETPSSGG